MHKDRIAGTISGVCRIRWVNKVFIQAVMRGNMFSNIRVVVLYSSMVAI
jgi:hypothetical protein